METNNGDLITDAMRWKVLQNKDGLTVNEDHVVAITNGGGIRAAIAKGDVTKKDINTVLPFGNTVAVVYVTGEQLLEALEASTFSTPTAVGGFPQVSGINFTIHTGKAYLSVYGDQYDTADGTGVRDYIHVVDLAKGHIAALNYLEKTDRKYDVFNLGTGKGTTVLQLVSAFEEASGRKVPYRIVGPRAGDVPLSFAAVEKAKNILGWTAEYDYKDCARDSWNWQVQNPNGYTEEG